MLEELLFVCMTLACLARMVGGSETVDMTYFTLSIYDEKTTKSSHVTCNRTLYHNHAITSLQIPYNSHNAAISRPCYCVIGYKDSRQTTDLAVMINSRLAGGDWQIWQAFYDQDLVGLPYNLAQFQIEPGADTALFTTYVAASAPVTTHSDVYITLSDYHGNTQHNIYLVCSPYNYVYHYHTHLHHYLIIGGSLTSVLTLAAAGAIVCVCRRRRRRAGGLHLPEGRTGGGQDRFLLEESDPEDVTFTGDTDDRDDNVNVVM